MNNETLLNLPNYDNPIRNVPNSTGVLVLGILSIIGCFCYTIPGIILSIIALALASSGQSTYHLNPHLYTVESYKNLKAGKVCAIIGLCISMLAIIALIIWFAFFKDELFKDFYKGYRP